MNFQIQWAWSVPPFTIGSINSLPKKKEKHLQPGKVFSKFGQNPRDTLIFIIPHVGIGPTELKVTMGKQVRTWDLQRSKWPNLKDQGIFFDKFLKSALVLQNKIQEVDELKEMVVPFGTWIGFFTRKQQQLSDLEKETPAGVFQFRHNAIFFRNNNKSFELPCHNSPESTMASMIYRFGDFDNSYLKLFSKLPKTAFHEAVVAGFGLSFWYQKILLEYYAYQTLLCPVIQDVQLIASSTGKILQPSDIVSIEPLKPISFRTVGIFRRITKTDLEQGVDAIFTPTYGFRRKALISKYFSSWIKAYNEDYNWKLPLLNERSLIFAPDEAPVTTGPIHGQSWFIPFMDNPDVQLAERKYVGDSLTLVFENYLGNPLPFNLKLELWATSYKKIFEVPAVLQTGCSLSADLLMRDGTYFLEIESGMSPYQVTWSNGVIGDLSQTLPLGNYDVKVTDAADCERTVQFTVPEFGTLEDIDGNTYKTVKVGTTWWMAENLHTTRKRDGTAILHLPSNEEWIKGGQPAYSWLDNTESHDENFGKLYNYAAACCDICPTGWRLPGIYEISELSAVFGLSPASALRALNAWPDGSLKSTNLSGLGFLPAGGRAGKDGAFPTGQPFATFWIDHTDPFGLNNLALIQGSVDFLTTTISTSTRDGFSVRCVKE